MCLGVDLFGVFIGVLFVGVVKTDLVSVLKGDALSSAEMGFFLGVRRNGIKSSSASELSDPIISFFLAD